MLSKVDYLQDTRIKKTKMKVINTLLHKQKSYTDPRVAVSVFL